MRNTAHGFMITDALVATGTHSLVVALAHLPMDSCP